MVRLFSTVILPCVFCLNVFGQKLKTVEAEYTYYAPENVTLEQARRTALDCARIQALADAFGTIASQYNATRIENADGHSAIDFTSIGGSEVKGEWIETIAEEFESPVFKDGMVIITCTVRGRAREIVSAQIDLQAHVLLNGTEDKFESDVFRSDDDLRTLNGAQPDLHHLLAQPICQGCRQPHEQRFAKTAELRQIQRVAGETA